MTLSKDTKQVSTYIPKELHDLVIKPQAKQENRSVSNLVATIIVDHYREKGKFPLQDKEDK